MKCLVLLKTCSRDANVHPFYRMLFHSMALQVLPPGVVLLQNDGVIQFPLNAVHGMDVDFPLNLLSYLAAYNESVTENQLPLTRSVLPEQTSSEPKVHRSRRVKVATEQISFFSWNIINHTVTQVQFAIPVLFEWFCGYQKHRQALYDLLTKQVEQISCRPSRNIRLMMLLDLVHHTALQEQMSTATADKICSKIQSMVLLGEICVQEGDNHNVAGWVYANDNKKQTVHILPPNTTK